MALTLQELINPKDSNTVKAELITLLQKYGFSATDWESGSEARTLLEIESDSLAQLWAVVTEIAKGMHLDTAEGDWLTLLARSNYQIERIPAEYTKGYATFSLIAGGGPRTISAGEIIVSDGLGHTFVTDNPVPVNLTTLASQAQIEIISQTTGSANNVAQGAITTVNQGPADITVINQGLLTPAAVQNNGTPPPFNVNTKTLIYSVTVDGVPPTPITYTFTTNYATVALLAGDLNADPTFSANLVASDLAGFLRIETKKVGYKQGISISNTGTANPFLGFSTVLPTAAIGGTTIDTPATILGASLAGPFNIAGKTLELSVIEDGVQLATQTVTFSANYPTINDVIVDWPGGIAYKTSSDTNRLKIESIKTGPKQAITLLQTGTANIDFGFSNSIDLSAVGSSAWITQEGRDEESDDSLRARCKAKWGILGAGVADAFTTWAREADPKVQKVAVYSNYLNGTPKAGAVTVYIAGLNSALDPTTVLNVYNYIVAKLPIMSDLYVGSVNIVPVYYTGTITITNNVNTPAFISAAKNNVTAYSQSLAIAQPVYKKRIEAELISALRPGLVNLVLTRPTSDFTTIDKNEMCVVVEDPAQPLRIVLK